ncbi:MAG: type II secretion system protein [Mariniblastus sp.]
MNSYTKNKTRGRGFTLVELLMVIAIISVMATMALGIISKSQDDAKASATISRITQIEAILQIQLENYEVRRLPIGLRELSQYCNGNAIRPLDANGVEEQLFAHVRNMKRRILMDIINSEMPRPLLVPANTSGFGYNSDVGKFPTELPGVGTGGLGFRDWLDGAFVNGSPSLSTRLQGVTPVKTLSWQRIAASPNWESFDLPGEYLYAILERIEIDGEPAIEMLGPAAVGNSDQDVWPEIVDSWGEPMNLRIWQVDAIEVDSSGAPTPGTDIWEDVANDFTQRDPATGFPIGYTVMDATVPRDLTKIRFEVASTRLENY